jgi:hypothetical protein
VAAGAGAEDVADFDQRRGEEGVDGEIRHFPNGNGIWQ